MNGKQLKNSILQWAIQGKLVPQDPNDEPASVLLEKIRQEKERLIKEKKIKRDKNASVIYRGEDNSYYEKILATGEVKCIDKEIPFDIPKGWEWCRLRAIIEGTTAGKSPNCEKRPKKEYEWGVLTTTAIQENVFLPTENKVLPPNYIVNSKHIVQYGDILITRAGPVNRTGVVCLVDKECGNLILSDKTVRIDYLRKYCNPIFIVLVLNSPAIHELLMSVTVGMAASQVNVSQGNIQNTLIPFPGIKEQNRIVVKITNLLPIIERYNSGQEQLEELNAQLPSFLKKSILQEAIQGKLVPQIESEGTAQELLEQIKAEKQKLVKKGKLKKSALNDSVIFKGDDNKYYEQIGKICLDITEQIPFDLPSSWNWVRGKTVFMPMESIKPSSDFVYIDVDAVNNRKNIIEKPKMVKKEYAPSRATRKLHKNDLLFSMVRPYLKNIALVDEKYKNAIASTGFYVITPSLGYYPMFLFYLMLSNYVVEGLNSFMKGDNSPSINNCHIEDYLYPLPPIEEQKRIVNKIDQLFKQLR